MLLASQETLALTRVCQALSELHRLTDDGYFFVEEIKMFQELTRQQLPQVTSVIVIGATQTLPPSWVLEDSDDAGTVILVPSDARDPRRADGRLLRDSEPTMQEFTGMIKELGT